jgi:predicted alpha/beta-fold hydrolase
MKAGQKGSFYFVPLTNGYILNMTTKIRNAASVAEERIIQLSSQFSEPENRTKLTKMSNVKTVHVPHLGGIEVAYQTSAAYDPSKPTLVLVNSFTTSSELYKHQLKDATLTDGMNLIAIELLGHGQTRTKSEHWTYWDTAIMNLQALDALDMTGDGKKVFVLGTSQGGWITVRMALLAPSKVSSSSFNLANHL